MFRLVASLITLRVAVAIGEEPVHGRRGIAQKQLRSAEHEANPVAVTSEEDSTSQLKPAGVPFSLMSLVKSLGDMPDRYNQIAVEVSYTTYWEQLITVPERKPRTFNVLLATLKAWLADMLVQLGMLSSDAHNQKERTIDWDRSLSFAVLGVVYLGLVQWFLYVTIFTMVCPHAVVFANEPISAKLADIPGQWDLIKQVFYDNFLIQPFMYFPTFYAIKELIGRGVRTRRDAMRDGLVAYRKNMVKDNIVSVCIWIPGDLIIYTTPMYLRMPMDHSMGFLWTMLLSYMRGGASK